MQQEYESREERIRENIKWGIVSVIMYIIAFWFGCLWITGQI